MIFRPRGRIASVGRIPAAEVQTTRGNFAFEHRAVRLERRVAVQMDDHVDGSSRHPGMAFHAR